MANPELLADLLDEGLSLPEIAARHNISPGALDTWLESEQVQSLREACRRFAAWRARYFALERIPRALNRLCEVMDSSPGTEKARRAANAIINLAFKKELSVPPGATGRSRSSEADQCRRPAVAGPAPNQFSGATAMTQPAAPPQGPPPHHGHPPEPASPCLSSSEISNLKSEISSPEVSRVTPPDSCACSNASETIDSSASSANPATRLDPVAAMDALHAELREKTRGLCGYEEKRLVKNALADLRAKHRAPM